MKKVFLSLFIVIATASLVTGCHGGNHKSESSGSGGGHGGHSH